MKKVVEGLKLKVGQEVLGEDGYKYTVEEGDSLAEGKEKYGIKYYVVGGEDVGTMSIDNDSSYSITTEAPRTNSSNKVKTDGWLGTNNNYAGYAYGEFSSLRDAQKRIKELIKKKKYSNSWEELRSFGHEWGEDTVEVWVFSPEVYNINDYFEYFDISKSLDMSLKRNEFSEEDIEDYVRTGKNRFLQKFISDMEKELSDEIEGDDIVEGDIEDFIIDEIKRF